MITITPASHPHQDAISLLHRADLELFAGFDQADWRCLMNCLQARILQFRRKDLIASGAKGGIEIGVVLEGQALEIRYAKDGTRSVSNVLRPGDVFRENIIANLGHDSDIVGARPGAVLLLNSCRIQDSEAKCPLRSKIIENLMFAVLKKQGQERVRLDIVTRKSLRERVVLFMREQAWLQGKNFFNVPLSRTELASYLCVDRSALSRELHRMKAEGIINISGENFEIGPKFSSACD